MQMPGWYDIVRRRDTVRFLADMRDSTTIIYAQNPQAER